MKRVLTIAFAALLTAAVMQPGGALNAAPLATHVTAGTVKVTVTYKGKGKVDTSHKLWVWLFDTPNIGAGSMPIAQLVARQERHRSRVRRRRRRQGLYRRGVRRVRAR